MKSEATHSYNNCPLKGLQVLPDTQSVSSGTVRVTADPPPAVLLAGLSGSDVTGPSLPQPGPEQQAKSPTVPVVFSLFFFFVS